MDPPRAASPPPTAAPTATAAHNILSQCSCFGVSLDRLAGLVSVPVCSLLSLSCSVAGTRAGAGTSTGASADADAGAGAGAGAGACAGAGAGAGKGAACSKLSSAPSTSPAKTTGCSTRAEMMPRRSMSTRQWRVTSGQAVSSTWFTALLRVCSEMVRMKLIGHAHVKLEPRSVAVLLPGTTRLRAIW